MSSLAVFAMASCTNKKGDNQSIENSDNTEIVSSNESQFVITDIKNNDQFKIVDGLIISDNLPIVIDFNAKWCPPCQKFKPVFEEAAEKYAGQALFLSIDIDSYPEIAQTYKVESIPAIFFIQTGGGELGQEVGYIDQTKLEGYINQLVATAASNSQ